jgi:hypothetical protein
VPASSKIWHQLASFPVGPWFLTSKNTLFEVLLYKPRVYQEKDGPQFCFQDSASLLLCLLPTSNNLVHIISEQTSINNDNVYSHSDNSNTDTTINNAPKWEGVTM